MRGAVVAIAVGLRALSAWACAGWVLRDELTARRWWLLPLQDLLAFVIWIECVFKPQASIQDCQTGLICRAGARRRAVARRT